MIPSHGLRLIVLALKSFTKLESNQQTLFRITENSGEGAAGNVSPTVHTAPAFNPTAQEAARQKTA
jgi:hypothetical protein